MGRIRRYLCCCFSTQGRKSVEGVEQKLLETAAQPSDDGTEGQIVNDHSATADKLIEEKVLELMRQEAQRVDTTFVDAIGDELDTFCAGPVYRDLLELVASGNVAKAGDMASSIASTCYVAAKAKMVATAVTSQSQNQPQTEVPVSNTSSASAVQTVGALLERENSTVNASTEVINPLVQQTIGQPERMQIDIMPTSAEPEETGPIESEEDSGEPARVPAFLSNLEHHVPPPTPTDKSSDEVSEEGSNEEIVEDVTGESEDGEEIEELSCDDEGEDDEEAEEEEEKEEPTPLTEADKKRYGALYVASEAPEAETQVPEPVLNSNAAEATPRSADGTSLFEEACKESARGVDERADSQSVYAARSVEVPGSVDGSTLPVIGERRLEQVREREGSVEEKSEDSDEASQEEAEGTPRSVEEAETAPAVHAPQVVVHTDDATSVVEQVSDETVVEQVSDEALREVAEPNADACVVEDGAPQVETLGANEEDVMSQADEEELEGSDAEEEKEPTPLTLADRKRYGALYMIPEPSADQNSTEGNPLFRQACEDATAEVAEQASVPRASVGAGVEGCHVGDSDEVEVKISAEVETHSVAESQDVAAEPTSGAALDSPTTSDGSSPSTEEDIYEKMINDTVADVIDEIGREIDGNPPPNPSLFGAAFSS